MARQQANRNYINSTQEYRNDIDKIKNHIGIGFIILLILIGVLVFAFAGIGGLKHYFKYLSH